MLARLICMMCLFLIVGCGGGGGNSDMARIPDSPPSTQPEPKPESVVSFLPIPFAPTHDPNHDPLWERHYSTDNLPSLRSSDITHSPIYTDAVLANEAGPVPFNQEGYETKIFTGIDQGDISALPVTGTRDNWQLRFGQLDDGVGQSRLVDYLQEAYQGQGGVGVTRWSQAPTVRIVGEASSVEEQIVAATVQLINASLPEDYKMTVGSPLPEDVGETANTIRIKFVPVSPDGAGARAWPQISGNAEDGFVVTDALIEFYQDANVYQDAISEQPAGIANIRRAVILMAHEMMHALADFNHPSEQYATILEGTAEIYKLGQNGARQPLSLLYPIDREALQAVYSLEPGTDPSSLGPWTSTSLHIHGNSPHAGFGVALRNGYAEPWAYGSLPETELANNSALSGTVTWNGGLVGFSEQRPVVGDASLSVNLATMEGAADFMNLETWMNEPGDFAVGSGTMWGDGDLNYDIAVRGNTFQQTGGDDGLLTGIFTGQQHEGMTGTLERDDLTAAFAGVK